MLDLPIGTARRARLRVARLIESLRDLFRSVPRDEQRASSREVNLCGLNLTISVKTRCMQLNCKSVPILVL